MKTVSHLAGLRGALSGCLSIQTTAISAHDLDRRTLLQPRFCALDAAVLQNIDDRMTLKIDHDRPVQALIDSILRGWRLPKFFASWR